ncbi:MAG: DMT family transporter [Burkholderiaceae bacterium]|jgi:drug/metabolite transporter (DMT)-like permease|nr:DMT family transporter [Burkholderiales bacterium]MCZ8338097.1 DMT family transporter [Burkholderiaceae bacterium]
MTGGVGPARPPGPTSTSSPGPAPDAAGLGAGLACALAAGLAWGLVFVAPVMLPDYPAAVLSVGRYLAFGLIALALAWPAREALARLTRADWVEAARLSLVGNLVYYACLAAAIQTAGVPLPTMLIGTLPVVIAVVSNLSERTLPWRRLAPSLATIAAGIVLVNQAELARLRETEPDAGPRLALGALLALGAVACWTWYPIRNARWMQRNPGSSSATWATAQGLTTLPLALAGALALAAWHAASPLADASGRPFEMPLGPRPLEFVLLMAAIGLAASWLGTLLWNRASRLLPTSLAGQLIVFETLAALAYGFLWRGAPPSGGAVAGIALLVAGVAVGVRTFQRGPLESAH